MMQCVCVYKMFKTFDIDRRWVCTVVSSVWGIHVMYEGGLKRCSGATKCVTSPGLVGELRDS